VSSCVYARSNPQGYINIALFTSIIGLLLCSTLLISFLIISGDHTVKTVAQQQQDAKVLAIAELTIFIFMWIFWFVSIICTTILADNTNNSWSVQQASCAFCWFSWFAVSGSLALAVMTMMKMHAAKKSNATSESNDRTGGQSKKRASSSAAPTIIRHDGGQASSTV
jgi:heme/copper-type cytochrome/quinol oxidase subunit 2